MFYAIAAVYSWVERRFTQDNALHNLLQRPRDVPVRTSLGVMGIAFYTVLLIVPPIAYWVTYRMCVGLQRSDRAVLEHGIETGVIKRLPNGGFIEVHRPLAGVDARGHAIPLAYQGAPVPKRMNQLGMGGAPVPGSLLSPDPANETVALARARAGEATAAQALGAAEQVGAPPDTVRR